MLMVEKTIDTTNIWLDVKMVAELKGITERAIRLALRNSNKYIFKEFPDFYPLLVTVINTGLTREEVLALT